MEHYNPSQTPNAAEWLELDEQERIDPAETYHRKARIKLPDTRMHATFQAVVVNQIAEGHEPVVRAMKLLTSTGLSRHDAIHAIGSVFAEHLFEVMNGGSADVRTAADYDATVERLTTESWLNSG